MLNFTYLDYVECIKMSLFTLGKSELDKIRKKLEKKVPKPLNTTFENRLSKLDSVKDMFKIKMLEKQLQPFQPVRDCAV